MTCIAGIAHRGQVYLAGDSAGIAGCDLTVRRDPKVFMIGVYVIGFAGSFRTGQLLMHAFKPPDPPTKASDLHRFLCTTWTDALRSCLKDAGNATVENGVERGGTFLLGVKGRLYRIEPDYQVGEASDGYDAIGCGENLALGALSATRGQPPDKRLRIAMEAAERHSAGVRRPFRYASTEGDA